ncbi:CG7079, partial [Drosophila busckii]
CDFLAEDVTKCRFGDVECIKDSMNALIKQYPRGIPGMGLKPIDVVDFKGWEVFKTAPNGRIWLTFKYFNTTNYGFENMTITEVKGFSKDPTATRMEIHGYIPSLIHKGIYAASGRIWFINVNSTGKAMSDLQKVQFTLKLKVILEYRDNKRYLRIDELVPIMEISRWIFSLHEFFAENTDLTIAVNRVINDNWVVFWNELEPTILGLYTSVFTNLISDVFDKVSYDDMFITDQAYA